MRFKYTSSSHQVCLRCASSVRKVCFKYTSKALEVRLKGELSVRKERFEYSSSARQCVKCAENTLQIYVECAFRARQGCVKCASSERNMRFKCISEVLKNALQYRVWYGLRTNLTYRSVERLSTGVLVRRILSFLKIRGRVNQEKMKFQSESSGITP